MLTINRMLASTVFKQTKGTGSSSNKALKTTPFGRSDAFTRGGFAMMPHATAPLSLMLYFTQSMETQLDYLVYGDESGTTGSDRCYSIGLLCVTKTKVNEFNQYVLDLKKKRGIVGELKWSKIKNSAGQANICIDLLSMVLRSSCCFHSIIVEKSIYNNWTTDKTDREKAFYQTYTYLLKNTAKQLKSKLIVLIDQKCDKYKKNDEVMGIVANNMLAKLGSDRTIQEVTMNDSKEHLGLQVVDILTGAVNSGYMKFLKPELTLSVAKEAAFIKMAAMLGWDKLVYDTYPNKDFNIWHFPSENRSRPATKAIVPNFNIKAVHQSEI
ncbi:DUF3800 domain-containing protein [Aestuariibacter sp. A3R04]|uniref:DUF3800 domain-containing protein n=1 Tax=Aestuariibacter sp. A3R04 TaxID=2841571 RepID=UPI00352F93A4